MAWKLGLDLGTNSIGWNAFTADRPKPDWHEWSLVDAGVRIIPDGREPAANGRVGDSLAVARRLARGMRRNRDHGINRIRSLVSHLIGLGLLPADEAGRKTLIETSPYDLRDQAVADGESPARVLSPHQLGRVLLHLGLRRGFKSNRKTDSGDEKASEFAERIGLLHRALKFHALDKATLDQLGEDAVPPETPWTLGQFLAARLRADCRCAFAAKGGISIPTAPCTPTNSNASGRRNRRTTPWPKRTGTPCATATSCSNIRYVRWSAARARSIPISRAPTATPR
jgi:CRISPR-associated endonuclease Csn1